MRAALQRRMRLTGDRGRAGNANTRELTLIRNVLGDLEALRQSIIAEFGVDAKRVWVKNVSLRTLNPNSTHPLPSSTFLHPHPITHHPSP